MLSTYKRTDVTLLLKDITGMVSPLPSEVREPLIQSGVHYSEMLPLEYVPSDGYMSVYKKSLEAFAGETARAVGALAKKIYETRGSEITLLSLARAGISIGVLLKRYLERYFECEVEHYAISIIRGKGIDRRALDYVLKTRQKSSIQFIDGWTGKGAIQSELKKSLADYSGIDNRLGVLSDPANVTPLFGTKDDFLIPSSCLNATVSGLISRTFFRDDIIGPSDYHGAAFYEYLVEKDLTYDFIERIESEFAPINDEIEQCLHNDGLSGAEEALSIAKRFKVQSINLVKPGIGETTRVLLRRVPWKVLVDSLDDSMHLGQIYQLAKERGVSVEVYPLQNYRACGIIKEMADN